MSIRKELLKIGGLVVCVLAVAALAMGLTENSAIGTASAPQERRQPGEILPVGENPAIEINAGESKLENAKATMCHGEWMGPAFSFISPWYTGLEYYATYQDPIETGCPALITYPFQVQNVYWEVFNPNPSPLNINLQPVIYNPCSSSPICLEPCEVCCYGPVYNVNLPAGPALIQIKLPIDCCVYGPYYAGVYSPDFIGTGLLEVVIDNAPPPFGIRACASYNNWAGSWVDLTNNPFFNFPGNLRLWSDGEASDVNTCDPCAQTIEPGVDLWTTPLGSSFDNHFTAMPIPADFFSPGSDPFSGSICLVGLPLNTNPSGALGTCDAIIERKSSMQLPSVGSSDMVPIEIVALSLVSCSPITITSVSDPPSFWDITVTLSSVRPQQQGSMTATKTCCNGGTFTSTLYVTPKFIFTEVGNPSNVRELDLGAFAPPIEFQTTNGHWSYEIPPPFDLVTCPGLVRIDHDLFPPSPDILIPPSSKFTPGFRTLPCDPQNPNDPYCGGKVLTLEQEQLAQHGVLPPQETTPIEGACCLPDGSCIITDPACCQLQGGVYQGDFTSCFPDPCVPPDTVYDTLCDSAQIIVTLNPSDFNCNNQVGPINLARVIGLPTVVCRTPDTPYVPTEIIETELIAMTLTGSHPMVGQVRLTESQSRPSAGQISVTTTDPSGNLTSGESFFDVFFDITLPDLGAQIYNPNPVRMEAHLTSLPPQPGTVYQMASQPPVLLLDANTQSPVGFLCFARHTIIPCQCCINLRGDPNGDGAESNILDLTFAVDRIFRGGPPAACFEEGNPNGDLASLNILDLTHFVDRIFRGGPAPVPCPAR